MMVDLVFYKENYGGDSKIPAASFPLWEKRAEMQLLKITGGKIEEKDDERIKICICEMAELMFEYSKNDGIRSENNDGYSVIYQNRDIKNELVEIAKTYLYNTKYLYRGVEDEG